MNRIKCVNCGFVSWATAETCKKCGGTLSEFHQEGASPSTNSAGVGDLDVDPINETPGRAKRFRILFVVIALIALSAGVFAFTSDHDGAQTFVLKDGSKKKSKAWFHSWFFI